MGGDRATGRNRVVRKKIEMDDDRLIELVRKNPSLYELDHSSYGSGVARAKTWRAIGAELKRHPLFCKKRWGNIRDNYKKAMKKYYWRVAQGFTHVKKYKFFDKLDFLAHQIANEEKIEKDKDKVKKEEKYDGALEVKCEPDIDPEFDDDTSSYDNFNTELYQNPHHHLHHHQPHRYFDYFEQQKGNVNPAQLESNIQHHKEDDTTTNLPDRYSQLETRVNADTLSTEPIDKEPDYDEGGHDEDDQTDKILSPKIEIFGGARHLGLSKRTKRKFEHLDGGELATSNAAKSMRYIVERVESDRLIERHPVDAFLSGIAPTLKSLSPYYLSLAKTQIYSIVQEYEMAMIMERRNENHRR